MVSRETEFWWWEIANGVMASSIDIKRVADEALYLAAKDELKKGLSNKEYMIGELMLEDIRNIKTTKLQKSNGEKP